MNETHRATYVEGARSSHTLSRCHLPGTSVGFSSQGALHSPLVRSLITWAQLVTSLAIGNELNLQSPLLPQGLGGGG